MRLLDTTTITFKSFFNNASIPPYAILSHTWGEEEVSFQDLLTPKAKDMIGYKKISDCCKQAVDDGFELAWVDTCCIDKTSSAELSEAINSMYQWYQDAQVCYVYLADVPSCDALSPNSKFGKSRWFTRGWTLQELLAPQSVVFYSSEWIELGTKSSLQSAITAITGVSKVVLLLNHPGEISVAQRMSWAANRETTRVEDIAYCLLGLFGVNMPAIQCGQPSRPTAGDGSAVRVLARTDGTAQIRPSRLSL
jgi:hypothetical protein